MDLLDPKLDVVFKMLFAREANREVLCAFLRDVLRPSSPIAEVVVLNPELPRSGADEKAFVLDLRVRLSDGAHLYVEMQNAWHAAFFERSLYYLSRLKSTELDPGDAYTQGMPTIAILVLDFVPRFASPSAPRFHRVFELRDTHDGVLLTRSMPMHVLTLPHFGRGLVAEADDPVLKWGGFLNEATNPEALQRLAMQDPDIAKAKSALEALSQDKEARFDAETRRINKLFYDYNLRVARQEAEAEGRAKGEAEGRAKGEAEGRAEGRVEGRAEAILRILEVRGVTLDEDTRARLIACKDLVALDRWLERSVHVQRVEELFET